MWTSKPAPRLPSEEPWADTGTVTLGGDPAAVSLGGERRQVPVYAPGGYQWRPAAGDQVLVLKAGAQRESPCVAGVCCQSGALSPGEVRISSGSGQISLRDSRVEVQGQLWVNAETLEALVERLATRIAQDVVSAALGRGSGAGGEEGG